MKSFLLNNWKNILLAISFFIIIVLVMSTICAKRDLGVAENNLKAANDTLHEYVLKNGELLYAKQGYIAKIDELEGFVGIKEKEIKELERTLKSKVATISKLQEQIYLDSLHMRDSVSITTDSTTNDTTYHSYFDYNDDWMNIDGETSFTLNPFNSHTIINCINMEVPLKIGTTKDNQWFAISENPYVRFTNIKGANLEKTSYKRWSVGVQGGIGLVGGVGLVGTKFKDISTQNTGAGWFVGGGFYLGIGVTYKFIEF